MSVPVKLLLSCNFKPGIEEAKTALAYLTQDFTESMREAGIDLLDVWYTVYGSWPKIRMSFLCQEPEDMQTYLVSTEWLDLKKRLLLHVHTLELKVVIAKDQFQF